MKKLTIFGSTGSIGKSALSVIRKNKNCFKVQGLLTNQSVDTLCAQIKEFSPIYVCIVDEQKAEMVKTRINKKIKIFKGQLGLEEFSSISSDVSLMAISGISALRPLMINIAHTKRVALANKESIVSAGEFVFQKAKRFNTEIIPVDSEINATFQLLKPQNEFNKVYLTASGGPLLDYSKNSLANVSVQKVLSHPTWSMGKRITVDSATLANKGFEVIETHHFFKLDYSNIGIVIHRESNVHAFIEFTDGSLFACMYPPNMQIPISFALNYPKRPPVVGGENFKNKFSLSFEPLKLKNFPILKIILDAAKRKDNSLAILNGCDEVAIEYFLRRRIKFIDMYKVMDYVFSHYQSQQLKTIEDIFFWDSWGREKAKEYINKL